MSVEFKPETPQSREEKTFALINEISKLQAENARLIEKIPTGMATPDSEIVANWNDEMGTLRRENKALKENMNALLLELKEVADSSFLPDGDSVNLSTKMWLERLVQKIEEKDK